jgi:hypothetical protein
VSHGQVTVVVAIVIVLALMEAVAACHIYLLE